MSGVPRCAMAFLLVHAAIASPSVTAQSSVQFHPSLTVTQTYDSNLFSTPSAREADAISRLTPGLEAERRSPRSTILTRHSLDVERFADHAELNSMNARQHSFAGWDFRPVSRLSFTAAAEFSRTQSP